MAPLNEKEIVIMGGLDSYRAFLGDVVIFNIKTKICQPAIIGGDYKFRADGN